MSGYLRGDNSAMKLARTSACLSVLAAAMKICGFFEKVVIANRFGTGMKADVYFASTGFLLSAVYLCRELIYPTVLPVYSRCLSIESDEVCGQFLRKLLCIAGAFGFGAAAFIFIFPGVVSAVIVPGFCGEKRAVMVSVMRYLSPGLVFFVFVSVISAVLHSHRKFFAVAVPELVMKVVTLILLAGLIRAFDIYAIAAAITAGVILCLVAEFAFLPERRMMFVTGYHGVSKYLSEVKVLLCPLLVGVVFSHISGLVDNALASTLGEGQLSYLAFAKKITDAVLFVGPVAIATVIYAQLSHLAAKENCGEFRELFRKALRISLFAAIPAGCFLAVLAGEVTGLIFEHGKFGMMSTVGTAKALRIYAVVLPTLTLEIITVYAFFAISNTKTPVKVGIGAVLIDVVLALVLLKPLEFVGIAAAFAISKSVKTAVLLYLLNKEIGWVEKSGIGLFAVKIVTAGGVMGGGMFSIRIVCEQSGLNNFMSLALCGTAGFVVFLLAARMLRMGEPMETVSLLVSKMRRRGGIR